MEALFKKRRRAFQEQQAKYLPYVFNDHFVLVLLFLFGFILVQYSQLLKHFPKNHFPVQLGLVILVVLLMNLGSVGIYLEKADQHFLLPKEEAVIKQIKKAARTSLVIWSLLQTVLLSFLFPFFYKLGLSLPFLILFLILLVALRAFILTSKVRKLITDKGLDWEKAITFEENRKQSILKFYSLFTNVKGISTKVKKRSYLNPLLKLVKTTHKEQWTNLYLRAFLRSSDYLGLFLRLLLLSVLSLLFISHTYLALGLALIFDYLILFQLLSLYHHYDYHYMSHLYPDNQGLKASNLLSFLRKLSFLILVVNLVVCHSLNAAIGLVLVMGILNFFYLPYKLKKIID